MDGGKARIRRENRLPIALAALLALATALAFAPAGLAKHHRHPKPKRPGPTAPLSHEGRWITDARGRVVITHGVNMVYKRPPYDPGAIGFDSADAQFLAEHGFNSVRLGTIYGAVEPQPGVYDDAYLDRIAAVQRTLARQKIFSLLDFHQDLYSERFSGEGFPDWAVIDDGLPAEPLTGFPGTYLSSPGGNRTWDNFWADRAGPDGVGLQEHYAGAWRHVAQRFESEPYVLGYDLINEPWPGTPWPTCVNVDGCPAFEQDLLAPMQQKSIDAIRGVDDHHLVWYEPAVVTNFGAQQHHPDTGDPQAGLSFHVYCLGDAIGAVPIPGIADTSCETLEELAISNAEQRMQANGDTWLLSEFGATANADTIERMVARADRHMASWQWWHYCGCDDPTTQGPGDTQAIVSDPFQPPTGDNVLTDKLALIDRPYPQVVAGTPESWSFDTSSGVFALAYSATTPSGKRLRRKTKTIVYVPETHFPDGYRVGVEGGRVTSAKDASLLVIRRGKSVDRVSVTVTPR